MILVSACLLGVRCRYDGRRLRPRQRLKGWKGVMPICPEELGGLSTPRPPAIIVGGKGLDVLKGRARVINDQGLDVTSQFVVGAKEVLRLAQRFGIRKAYLKAESPSCGEDGVARALLERSGIKVFTVQ